MGPPETTSGATPDPQSRRAARVVVIFLVAAALLIGARVAMQEPSASPLAGVAADPGTTTTAETAPTTVGTATTEPAVPSVPVEPPAPGAEYEVPATEAQPDVKQLAVDIAYFLTTYEESDDHLARLAALESLSGVDDLAEAALPLTHPGSWSRGEVIYPQLGGLRNDRASVMVVTRQTVGSGSEAEFSVVRTLDIRLVLAASGWVFDSLRSAGGTFDDLEELLAAQEVASDPRIEMPDSARLDIISGLVSPVLIGVMADLAELTPYGVVVLATGHPIHVFETDRVSHHTIGQAVDIYRFGDSHVVDDRDPESATRAIAEWIYAHPDVVQVGSPWDLDAGSSRSFTDAVHQDHVHVAVGG